MALTAFWAYDRPLETVSSFKCLESLLTATNEYWPAVIANLHKFRKSWSFLDIILGHEGAGTWTLGRFYVAVVQDVVLFWSEIWVVTPALSNFWGDPTIGWLGGSQGICHGSIRGGCGSTPLGGHDEGGGY